MKSIDTLLIYIILICIALLLFIVYRVTQPHFDHLVHPAKFDHLHTFYTNLDGLKCIEVVESTKWSK